MQDSDGFHAAPVLRDRADADERTGDVVDADGGAALAARGCPDLDRLAVPERDGRALVEGRPFGMDRRVHGRDLLDPTDERPARLLEVTSLESGDRDLREDAALGVVSVGREPEADRRDVLLVLVHEVRRELGRLADQDW